jgi:hypothetical protein
MTRPPSSCAKDFAACAGSPTAWSPLAARDCRCLRCRLPHSITASALQKVRFVDGRPMMLEVVEKGWPVGLQAMLLKIAQRKGKSVVDADQHRHILGQPLDQPFGDAAPRPVFTCAGRWQHFAWQRCSIRHVDTQPIQARCRRLCPGIIDADVAIESGTHATPLAWLSAPPTAPVNINMSSKLVSNSILPFVMCQWLCVQFVAEETPRR